MRSHIRDPSSDPDSIDPKTQKEEARLFMTLITCSQVIFVPKSASACSAAAAVTVMVVAR